MAAGNPILHRCNYRSPEDDPVAENPPQPPVRPGYRDPPVLSGSIFSVHPEYP